MNLLLGTCLKCYHRDRTFFRFTSVPLMWDGCRWHLNYGYELRRSSQVIWSRVNSVLQETKLVEKLDSSLSSQTPRPQVGHLLLSTSTSMTLSHLIHTYMLMYVWHYTAHRSEVTAFHSLLNMWTTSKCVCTLYASSHISLTLYMWTAAFHSSASMKWYSASENLDSASSS